MAVTTTIAPHYGWRLIAIGVVSAVLGVWGIYDYAVAIPNQQRAFDEARICELVRDALDSTPGADEHKVRTKAAFEALMVEAQRIVREKLIEVQGEVPFKDQAELQTRLAEAKASLVGSRDGVWFEAIELFIGAILTPRPPGPLSGIHQGAHDTATKWIDRVGTVSPPSRFDRTVQWAFILCLPMAPYFFWIWHKTRRRVFRLDDDGTLHLPGEKNPWSPAEIADIDMSRWMARSTAWMVHTSGRRVLLDDYKHKHLHLIVGSVASRLYPDEWTPEAKRVKSAEEEAAGAVDEESGESAAGEAASTDVNESEVAAGEQR